MRFATMLVIAAAFLIGNILSVPRHHLAEDDLQANVQTGYLVKMEDDNDADAVDVTEGPIAQKEGHDDSKSRVGMITNMLMDGKNTEETNTTESGTELGKASNGPYAMNFDFFTTGWTALSKSITDMWNANSASETSQSTHLLGGLGTVFALNALSAVGIHSSGSSNSPLSKDKSNVRPFVPEYKSKGDSKDNSLNSGSSTDSGKSSESSSYGGGSFMASSIVTADFSSKSSSFESEGSGSKRDYVNGQGGEYYVGGPRWHGYHKEKDKGKDTSNSANDGPPGAVKSVTDPSN